MKKHPLLKLSLKTGLISGALAIVMFLTFYFIDVHLFEVTFQLDFWVPLPFVALGAWYFRKLQGNELRFWQGFVIGYITSFMTAILSASFAYVFLEYIDPEFLQASKEASIAYFETNKLQIIDFLEGDEEAYIENLNNFKAHIKDASPGTVAMDKFIRFSGFGLFYAFIVSLILRK